MKTKFALTSEEIFEKMKKVTILKKIDDIKRCDRSINK